MNRLAAVTSTDHIFPQYLNTPVGMLLEYHNLGRPHETFDSAQLLIGTCMDFRININMPANFAFVIRTGGANMQFSDFYISFAFATGSLKHMALIGHNDCRMTDLQSKRELFITGLAEHTGVDPTKGEDQFENSVSKYEIGNEVDFVVGETIRLRKLYPKVLITPMMYLVEDSKLYLIEE
ncbi:MAG: carbonic anhydrase [Bacteroidales bacterium]|nr:carbonic anhydrase [Bacteroidales bacterium]